MAKQKYMGKLSAYEPDKIMYKDRSQTDSGKELYKIIKEIKTPDGKRLYEGQGTSGNPSTAEA